MTKACLIVLLSCLALGCRSSPPPPHQGSEPACARRDVALRIGADGSVSAQDTLVYEPGIDDGTAFKAFLATRLAQDPCASIQLLAAPDVSLEMLQRISALAGEDARNRGRFTFKIEGSVQSTLRSH